MKILLQGRGRVSRRQGHGILGHASNARTVDRPEGPDRIPVHIPSRPLAIALRRAHLVLFGRRRRLVGAAADSLGRRNARDFPVPEDPCGVRTGQMGRKCYFQAGPLAKESGKSQDAHYSHRRRPRVGPACGTGALAGQSEPVEL